MLADHAADDLQPLVDDLVRDLTPQQLAAVNEELAGVLTKRLAVRLIRQHSLPQLEVPLSVLRGDIERLMVSIRQDAHHAGSP